MQTIPGEFRCRKANVFSKNLVKTNEIGNGAISISYQLDPQRWLRTRNGTWSWTWGTSVISRSEREQEHIPLAQFIIFQSMGLRRSVWRRCGAFYLAL